MCFAAAELDFLTPTQLNHVGDPFANTDNPTQQRRSDKNERKSALALLWLRAAGQHCLTKLPRAITMDINDS